MVLYLVEYVIMLNHFKTQKRAEPSTCPARTTTTTTATTMLKEEEATESMGYALATAEGGKGMLHNTLA